MVEETKSTFYFGYGTIRVGSYWHELIFQSIEPPQEVGTDLNKVEPNSVRFVGQIYAMPLSWEDLNTIFSYLDYIEEDEGGEFEFKGWIFDFHKYNPKSIEAIRSNLENIRKSYLSCMAC